MSPDSHDSHIIDLLIPSALLLLLGRCVMACSLSCDISTYGGTRLVLHVPSSSRAEAQVHYPSTIIIINITITITTHTTIYYYSYYH